MSEREEGRKARRSKGSAKRPRRKQKRQRRDDAATAPDSDESAPPSEPSRGFLFDLLFKRIDIAGLAVFRVLFGILMAYDMGRYVVFGWIHHHYIDPPMTFGFIGFLWVDVLPTTLMYAAFGVMVGAGIGIALGAYYRLSCFLFCLGHTYVFLVGAEFYLNHAYLISVVSFLMIFVPAHRAMSVDAIRVPGLYSRKVYQWPLVLVLGMFGVVYTYGAIAKINADWIYGFEPIRHWLHHRANTAMEPMATMLRTESVVAFVALGGLVFDLLVTPALLWRRTRVFAVIGSLGFHLTNAYLFNIGIFPWFMIASTTLFFHPSWPRKLANIGPQIAHYIDDVVPEDFDETRDALALTTAQQQRITWAIGGFFVVMVLVPLRHHLYPGPVAWSEEGHYFSWRMKLRDKRGRITLRIKDPATGNTWTIDPNTEMSPRQVRKLQGRPDMLLQYVHFVRDRYKQHNQMDVEIRADIFLSLNYRAEQRFVDPDVDLAKVEHGLGPYTWILPFENKPLPSPVDPVQSSLSRAAARIRIIAQSAAGSRPRMPVRRAPARTPPTPN